MKVALVIFIIANLAISPQVFSKPLALETIEPKSACSFLEIAGLKSQGWGELGSGDYGCPSEKKEFGPASALGERNDITYYVSSADGKLEQLKLIVNINNPKAAAQAKNELKKATKELLGKLGIKEVPKSIVTGINEASDATAEVEGIKFKVSKMSWGGNTEQFSLKFTAE